MDFIKDMKEKARLPRKRLVSPEGRTVRTARIITDGQLATSVTLMGRADEEKAAPARRPFPYPAYFFSIPANQPAVLPQTTLKLVRSPLKAPKV